MGLDAWRRLCSEYDPVNAISNHRLLKKLTHPSQVSSDHLRRTMEEWEADLKEHRDRTSKNLDDDQMALALRDMRPESLQNHLELHASRLKTSELMRKEIDAFLDARESKDTGGATPMDIDALRNGKGASKGKPSS